MGICGLKNTDEILILFGEYIVGGDTNRFHNKQKIRQMGRKS